MIADAVAPGERVRAYGLLNAALAAGGTGAGLIAAALGRWDLRLLFVADALTCLACALILRLALPADRPRRPSPPGARRVRRPPGAAPAVAGRGAVGRHGGPVPRPRRRPTPRGRTARRPWGSRQPGGGRGSRTGRLRPLGVTAGPPPRCRAPRSDAHWAWPPPVWPVRPSQAEFLRVPMGRLSCSSQPCACLC
ncbi:MFS transporter [Streptomyces sp. NPDC046557]|uniref:MFS transporter n=1 Tax=Streptomyces sp. NPDC046557 TaxID=3155372 RepID=UPI0033E149EE